MTHPAAGQIEAGQTTVTIDADLEELIPGFLANRRKDIANIQIALEAGEWETIRILGHGMKGAGGGYGFDAVTDLGAALEQAAAHADRDAVGELVGRLAHYLAGVQIVFA